MEDEIREEFEFYVARYEVGKNMTLPETQGAVIEIIKYLLSQEEKEDGKTNQCCKR